MRCGYAIHQFLIFCPEAEQTPAAVIESSGCDLRILLSSFSHVTPDGGISQVFGMARREVGDAEGGFCDGVFEHGGGDDFAVEARCVSIVLSACLVLSKDIRVLAR